jgi:thrombospondin 2/3/4/5
LLKLVASTDLEQIIQDDFVISLKNIRPRRKFLISLEALFMVDFPGAKNKFSFYLDRKEKRVVIDINSNAKTFSKHLDIPFLNETTMIRSLAFAFSQNIVNVYVDCQDVLKNELEFNLSKLFQDMDEPLVKLFRERKYPLFLDESIEDAMDRFNCDKIPKKKSNHKFVKDSEGNIFIREK